jgi:hypothetical protein
MNITPTTTKTAILFPDVPIELRRKSRVKELVFDFACVDSGPLIAILRLPVALESYTHSFSCEDLYNNKISPGCFHDLLYSHRHIL